MRLRAALAALGLLGVVAVPASAQRPGVPLPASLQWVLREVEFSACVDFLIEPVAAAKQLGEGYRIVSAGAFTPLSPVLRREIAGDTVHAGWVPSSVCFLEAQSISVGDRALTAEAPGDREVVGFWGIAATRTEGASRQDQWFAAKIWSSDWHVQKLTEGAYIPMSVFKRALVSVPETTRHHYQIKIGKTVLSWDGELVGRDSTAAASASDSAGAAPVHLVFDGERHIRWNATITTQPQWSRYLPGVFRVEGKDDLAKALKASPIRMFGPMQWGGNARVEFSR
jgi:hypothetical protein